MSESTNKLGDFAKSTLDSVRSMLDANTVIGTPVVTAGGVTLIPVSKITVGYASGGLDYGKKDVANKPNNFGGGGGTGVSVTPVALIVVGGDNNVSVLNISSDNTQTTPTDTVSQVVNLIERSPELITKVRDAFAPKKESNVDFGE